MDLSTFGLLVLLASSAVECAKSYKKSEICPCIPINICPRINRFNKEDAKYFTTVLKCEETGFVRCCPAIEKAIRRSDDAENVILVDEVQAVKFESLNDEPSTEIAQLELEVNESTDIPDIATEAVDYTTQNTDPEIDSTTTEELLTTEPDTTEAPREPKFIDNSISVIYPNHKYPEVDKQQKIMEHLFLIFPNGEIEAALTESKQNSSFTPMRMDEIVSEKPRRVIVRKRRIKQPSDLLEGAESQISRAVIEPMPMDVEEVKKRLSGVLQPSRRKTDLPTTESTVDETTKKPKRKKIKFRKQMQTSTTTTTTVAPFSSTTTLKTLSKKIVETTTKKSRRKIIYDTSSRTNFLKRPSASQSFDYNDELIEPEVTSTTTTTTTNKPEESSTAFVPLEIITKTTTTSARKHSNHIDVEHKAMIETVHRTLSAIHSGVDVKLIEKMLINHQIKLKEMRKKPTTTAGVTDPTRPYRGSARFRKPATTQPQDNLQTHSTRMRTRNLSRTRNTATTTHTTHKSMRKVPRTFVTQTPINHPVINSNVILEDVDMLPKHNAPTDFKASPLFGITMDQFNEFDNDMIEKIHETLRPARNIQSGFFPVIQNGTPSTLL